MSRAAIVFLVLLRLAIGWHFLFEGVQKVQSVYVGETTTNKPFSSLAYFREATGPGGIGARYLVGDPDEEALARLTPVASTDDKDPANTKPGERLPAAVAKDLDGIPDRIIAFFDEVAANKKREAAALAKRAESDAEREKAKTLAELADKIPLTGPQREKLHESAKTRSVQAKDTVALWLVNTDIDDKTPERTKKYPSGEVKRKMTTPERVAEYRQKLDEVKQANQRNWAFGRDVEKSKYRQLKSEAVALRTGLMQDLEGQYDSYRKDLTAELTTEQKAELPVTPSENRALHLIDLITRWGLIVVGGCLLLGLFTRTNAWLAAGFLLSTYLLMPAFPWLPSVGPSEGNYLFVNKNVVEMFALCVLGATSTGYWFGLDAIIGWMFGSDKQK